MKCLHEVDNPFDMFAVKVCLTTDDEMIVGHLPMEISRITKFLIDRGADVLAKLTSTNYRSPLVQGGLEIPFLVTLTMPGTVLNQLLLERFKQLVEERYSEPKSEEIIFSFLHVDGLANVATVPFEPIKKKKMVEATLQNQDIRNCFAIVPKSHKEKPEKPQKNIVVID